MVGILLDGREHGPGARAFAEDISRFLARDGEPTHLFSLVPTSVQTPRLVHSLVRVGKPAARLDDTRVDNVLVQTSEWSPREYNECREALAEQVIQHVARHELRTLHAVGLDLPAAIAQTVHERTGIPFFVTPRGRDLAREGGRFETRARAAMANASAVITFDQETKRNLETRFGPRADQRINTQVLPRGIDLKLFYPIAKRERAASAEDHLKRKEVADRLDGIDWDHAYVVFAVEPHGDRHAFEQFLFAVPEILRLQPQLQIIVVGDGEKHSDGLRAAMTAGRPELLHTVVQSSELCQPLVDHLERLHQEGRAEAWWNTAGRIEPERRIRFLGHVTRNEFAALLRSSDLFVSPGITLRPPSQALYEALACGVLPLCGEVAGINPLAHAIGEEISAEFASFCVLRSGVQPVREMEEKIGRLVLLRPEISNRLRQLAESRFSSQVMANALRNLYEKNPGAAVVRL